MILPKIFLTATLFVTLSVCEELPTVTTKLGTVRGLHRRSFNGRVFSSFEGVPYAEPPVGQNRFKAPRPIEPWTGIWNATQPFICMQNYFITGVSGEEDCLYLNIYVPRSTPNPQESLNVVVYIHGGGFMAGSAHKMGGGTPEFLMDRELIFVGINYRLGPLGFLDTEDETITANNGLRDQVLALQWIKENIKDFGGNPDSVTLLGVSAGAASADLHYVSPLSKGLFHRGISISGSSLNPWAIQEAPLLKAKYLSYLVGCPTETNEEMIQCLRRRPGSLLTEYVQYFYGIGRIYSWAPFGPTIEENRKDAFLPDDPEKLLEQGNVNDAPWIFSITKDEGIFPAVLYLHTLSGIDDSWTVELPHILDYNYTITDEAKRKEAADLARSQYLGDEKLNATQFIKLVGHRHFIYGVEKEVKLRAKVTKYPLYFYVLSYERGNPAEKLEGEPKRLGVSHGSDLSYIFPQPARNVTTDDIKVKDFYLDFIEHFANSSTPHIETWLPVGDAKEIQYLDLNGEEDLKMVTAEEFSPFSFWKKFELLEKGSNSNRLTDEL